MMEVIERLYYRILMMVGCGRIKTGKDDGPVQMLQVQLGADEIRDNTPRLAEFGFTSMPPENSDAIMVCLGGDRSSGVIIATGHQASRLKNLAPGESALYDAFGKYVKLTETGIVVEANGQPVVVSNASTVEINATTSITLNAPKTIINGALAVSGIATVGGLSATGLAGPVAVTGDVTADGISLKTHAHTDPQGGNTGAPI